jgi:hypothetical protein
MGTLTRGNGSTLAVATALNETNFLPKGGGGVPFLPKNEIFLLKINQNKNRTFFQTKNVNEQ